MELTADRRLRLPRSAPFAAAAMFVWGSVLVGTTIDWVLYAIATALLLLAGVPRLILAHRRRVWEVTSSLIFLAAVAVLRASAGGANSGVAVVALITVFYVALYGEDRPQLCIIIAGVAAFYLIPIVLIGPPQYPHAQYRAALLTVSVAAIIGIATRRLVEEVRHQAQEAGDRERMLEQVNEVVRTLSYSSRAREEVCEAAKTVGEASVAALFEPVRAGASTLRATATSGIEIGYTEISDRRSAIVETFASGRPCLITEDIERHLGSREMWEVAGRPTSVLYEPLMRGAEPVGVLAVGWSANVRAEGSRATVVALLAHEAAAVIERADTLSELTDMASTDPLTGLPNRRAWDAHINKALAAGRQFIVAMLDLDHFKEFNDTYGHPTGDRLLKETAAIWRQQLRSGDLVARLGGEEFGLLLIDCDAARANDVIERLRGLVYYEQTCSVGFAHRRAGESADAVMARADAALYEAKASGRDRVCVSG
jgi:diguanylate cyclase (GGDEF)-like protein